MSYDPTFPICVCNNAEVAYYIAGDPNTNELRAQMRNTCKVCGNIAMEPPNFSDGIFKSVQEYIDSLPTEYVPFFAVKTINIDEYNAYQIKE